jgi:hypothetical protein
MMKVPEAVERGALEGMIEDTEHLLNVLKHSLETLPSELGNFKARKARWAVICGSICNLHSGLHAEEDSVGCEEELVN